MCDSGAQVCCVVKSVLHTGDSPTRFGGQTPSELGNNFSRTIGKDLRGDLRDHAGQLHIAWAEIIRRIVGREAAADIQSCGRAGRIRNRLTNNEDSENKRDIKWKN